MPPTESQLIDYFIFDAEDVDVGTFSRAKTDEVAAHFGMDPKVALRALNVLAKKGVLSKTRDVMKRHKGEHAVGYQWWEYYWKPGDRERYESKTATTQESPMPRKDDEQILDAAEKAGIQYANDQLGSDYFMDWVREQVAEAEQMRRDDPSSVMPTETKSQARKVARNMLQQLEWDTKRELNVLDYVSVGDVKPEEVVKKFYEGFDWALRGDPAPGDQKVEDWLADEILALSGEARGGGAREAQHGRTPSIDMYQEAQIFINGKYQVGFTLTPSRGPEAAAREVLSIARNGDTIEVKQGQEVWTYKVTRRPGKPATIVEVRGGVREAYGRGRYGRRSGGGGDTPRWKQDEEDWQRQRTEYQAKVEPLKAGLVRIVGGDELLRRGIQIPTNGTIVASLSDPRRQNEPVAHFRRYPGFGYGEDGGIGQTYFVDPTIVPAGKEAREAKHEHRAQHENAQLDTLLSGAKSTVDNRGQWSASFEDVYIWIGDSSGSRVGQYEADVNYDERSVQLRSRSYESLCRQIKKAIGELKGGGAISESRRPSRRSIAPYYSKR